MNLTNNPTLEPSQTPNIEPSAFPYFEPSFEPSQFPTFYPEQLPTNQPSQGPTSNHTDPDTKSSSAADYTGYYIVGGVGAFTLLGFAGAAIYCARFHKSYLAGENKSVMNPISGNFDNIDLFTE